jgi:glycosyltransferase involved in cell wall biosynthesis
MLGAGIQLAMFSGKTRLLADSALFDIQHFSSATGLALPLRKALRLCASMTRDNFVSPHTLFDYAFFRQHGEIGEHENPLITLLRSGDRRGLQPCELFDPRFYLATYPDVASRKTNSLSHFVQIGASEKRNPHVLFDTAWYLRSNPDVVALAINPLSHFVDLGGAELRNPHPLFDSRWYAEQDPPGFKSGDNPLVHYLRTGHDTRISPHPLFDAKFYLAQYPQVVGKNPLIDYLTSGGKSGRNPSPDFDSAWYLEQNPDVRVQELNPLAHYISSGAREGRRSRGAVSSKAVRLDKAKIDKAKRPEALPGITFVGPVTVLGGLGKSARGYVDTIRSAGVACSIYPWTAGYEHLPARPFEATGGPRYNVNVVHLNLDFLGNLDLMQASVFPALQSAARYNVAIVYWELSSLEGERAVGLQAFDEVWCATTFIAHALRSAGFFKTRIVRPALKGMQPPSRSTLQNLSAPARYTFLYVCDIGHGPLRKNVDTLIKAFAEEFKDDEGVSCVIKLINATDASLAILRALIGSRRDIILVEKTLDDEEMARLFAECDCYVSPHRSEGLGLTLLEAMSIAKPIICTPYGGVTDFVSSDNAILLEYDVECVGDGDAVYPAAALWANPRLASLKTAMRQAYRDRDHADELGRRAQASVHRLFSPPSTATILLEEFRRIQRDAFS